MKIKKVKIALFAVMLLSIISAAFSLNSQKIFFADASSPSGVVITRTSGLDLASSAVSYVSSSGIVKTVNPQLSNITDTAEGWAWYKTQTTVNGVLYKAQTLVLSGIDFQINQPFTASYYFNPGWDVSGCALRMPISGSSSDSRVILEDGTVNTIVALDPINNPGGVQGRTTFDFYTIFLTCEINGNGILSTENLDLFVGPPNSGYHYIEFGADGSSPTVNILHGKLYNPNGNVTIKGGTFNIVNDIITGNRVDNFGNLLTATQLADYELMAVQLWHGTIYISGNNTNFYAKGRDYGFSYGSSGNVIISGNGTVVFEGGTKALVKAPTSAPTPTSGNWNQTKVVYGGAENVSVILENIGRGAYGFGYYASEAEVEIYAGTKNGYVFDKWSALGACSLANLSLNKTTLTLSDENVTVTALWKEASYKIFYNLNGGMFTSEAPSEYTFGNDLTIPAPSWGANVFEGWYDNAMLIGSPVTYISSEDYGNKTFWAKWNANFSVLTSSSSANGSIIPNGSIIYDGTHQDYTIMPNPGYKISSFTVGGVDKFNEIDSYKYTVSGIVSDTIIVATFEKLEITDIVIYASAQSGGSISPSGFVNVNIGESQTFNFIPDLNYEVDDVIVNNISQGALSSYTFTNVTGNQSILVKFKMQINQYNIIYDLAGGTHEEGYPLIHTYGNPTNLVSPTKSGYTFSGWYLDGIGSPITVLGAGDYTKDIYLLATWTINKYTLTFHNGYNGNISSEEFDYNSTISYPSQPTRTGYTFDGWDSSIESMPANTFTISATWTINKYFLIFHNGYDGNISSEEVDFNSTIVYPTAPTRTGYTFDGWDSSIESMPANTLTITATWTINKYFLIFHNGYDSNISSEEVDYNSAISYPSAPTRTGYTFEGWNSSIENMPANTLTIAATWKINKYTLTFYNGYDGNLSSEEVDYNSAISYPSAPTRTGYTFEGWNSSIENMPANTLTISATWTINKYTLTFYNGYDGNISSEEVDFNSAISYPSAPTRTGYTFNGWDSSIECMPASTLTITATWTKNQNLIWLISVQTVLLFAGIAFAAYKILKDKKSKNTVKTFAFAPLFLSAIIPSGQIAATIVLGVLCGLVATYNIYLYLIKDRLMKKQANGNIKKEESKADALGTEQNSENTENRNKRRR